MKPLFTFFHTLVFMVASLAGTVGWGQVTLFSENMYNGTGGSSGDAISVHEANDRFNEDILTYSGTGDMRTTSASSGYTGASGTWNSMLNASGETFIINGVDASSYTNLELTFGIRKSTTAENGSGIVIEYSTTGVGGTYQALSGITLPTGSGTATWHQRTINTGIPASASLTIRFRSTSTTEWRLDDIILTGMVASATVGFASATSSVAEGNSGAATHQVAVSMNSAPAADVTVEVTDAGSGTATDGGVDYSFTATSLTFTAAESYPATKTVDVNIVGETAVESDETIVLGLAITGGTANLGTAAHTVTILNDDAPPTIGFTLASSSVSESAGTHSVGVSLSNYGGAPVAVSITPANGTAEAGDYTLNTTSLTFTGDGTQQISLDINQDADLEDESFTLTLAITAGTAILGTNPHTITITDDDIPLPGDLIITEIMYNPSGMEPNAEWFEVYNTTAQDIDLIGWVVQSGASTHTISGSVIVSAGSYEVLGATTSGCGNEDYTYGTGISLNNSSDDVSIRFGATVIDEVAYQTSGAWPSSTNGYSISLNGPAGQDASSNDSGVNWCLSASSCGGGDFGTPGMANDYCTTVSFNLSASSITEGNSGQSAAVIQVTVSSSPATNVTVDISDAGAGTATSGVDYTFTSPTTLTFTDGGPTTQSVSVLVNGDTSPESDESVVLSLNVSGGPAGNGSTLIHTLTINNDDAGTYYSSGSGSWTSANLWANSCGEAGVYTSSGNEPMNHFVICAGHTVTIPANVTANALTAEAGSTLHLNTSTASLTVNNGNASGADFIVNGTFRDDGGTTGGLALGSSATWQMGPNGTVVKTNTSSSNIYQTNYEGGINQIPASANWVIQYEGTSNISVSTIDAVYPNLIIQSNSGLYNPNSGSGTFQGSSGYPTIKGNLDIGGSGSGTVNFYNQCSNSTPVTVEGNLIVRSGSSFINNFGSNNGTGLKVSGNVTVAGTLNLSYGAPSAGILELAGAGTQSISGSGTMNINNLRRTGGGTATLARSLTVNNTLTLSSGYIVLGSNNLTVQGNIAGGSAASYVVTDGVGELRQSVGPGSTSYPVGISAYNPAGLALDAGSTTLGVRVVEGIFENGLSGQPITSEAVNRMWDVNGSIPVGRSLTVTVQWNDGEQLDGFDRASCYIAHYTGGGWDAVSSGMATGSGPYNQFRANISGLSPFAVRTPSALPIELLGFQGRQSGDAILLNWQTATELFNDYMAVEHSPDARTFTEIGRVSGAGTSLEKQSYQFLHHTPLPDINYYRLRQVDFDGRFEYFRTIAVPYKGTQTRAELLLFPNPASESLEVQYAGEWAPGSQMQVFGADGRLWLTQGCQPEAIMQQMDISRLPDGLYLLQLNNGTDIKSRRFMKSGR
ncbi:MAG: lamin tail domain-containing protein [Lewinellaceae bacterium]|nr:lamin tail domain-containing protein [Lewinellaceae bacterium]